ncbi:unnamed protein product [Linum tenue]|uniref:Uncharacterized protein n=1 Tax=Linum tenue TaxID=586396 RepID=A0AAV0JXF3_9ROSI|nr:unnamed protein product [Linum tenue]
MKPIILSLSILSADKLKPGMRAAATMESWVRDMITEERTEEVDSGDGKRGRTMKYDDVAGNRRNPSGEKRKKMKRMNCHRQS